MLSVKSLILLAAIAAPNQVELIQFSASWCGPCQLMQPTIERLRSAGYPVRHVDIDQQQGLATRFGVRDVPCFVLLADGREVDRVVGATSFARLEQMFASTAAPAPTMPRDQPAQRGLHAVVRLKVEDAQGHSYGSGTIVDVHQKEALVLTCGHIFRQSQGQGRITVDLFNSGAPGPVQGRLVGYDLERDIGLVAISPGFEVTPVPVAGNGFTARPGDRVFSVGCDRGGEPRVEHGRIVAVNKYLGPANFVVSGRPVDGRSGGGLFSSDGQLIGVCNAADPAADEGLYAALPTVHEELDRAGLAFVYQDSDTAVATAVATTPRPLDVPHQRQGALADARAPAAPRVQPARQGPPGDLAAARQLVSPAVLERLLQQPDGAEVVCIVRSRQQPSARSHVFVLDQPSGAFLSQLSTELQSNSPQLTDMRVRQPSHGQPVAAREVQRRFDDHRWER